MSLRKVTLIFYVLIICSSSIAQPVLSTYTDAYDFNFTMKQNLFILYPWNVNAAYKLYTIPFYKQEISRPLYMRKYVSSFPFSDRLETELEQRILFPVHAEKEGELKFECKGENLKFVSILLDGIDDTEKSIYSDTLTFVPDSSFSRVSRTMPLLGIEMLNVRIHVEGKECKDAFVAFSKIAITIGNKTIDAYPVRKLSQVILHTKIDTILLYPNIEKGYQKIEVVKNKKIIALGESLHGSYSVKYLAYKLIFEAVKNQNCKLVLLEIPLEKSLFYNRYIIDSNFKLDKALIDKQLIAFLETLRDYNQSQKPEKKVRLLGMDYNSIIQSKQNSAIDIFDFVTCVNDGYKLPEIDRFSLLLMEKDWNNAVDYLEKNKNKILKLLTFDEIKCISHILRLSKNMGTNGIERYIKRDSVMFVNADFLLKRFSATSDMLTMIYGHSVHVNPVSTYPAVYCNPMGMYMKSKYQENYVPLLLVTGVGHAMAYDRNYNKTEKDLEEPPVGSIELFLQSLGEKILFMELSPSFNRIILSRFKGSHHSSREFYPYNLYQRYKGLFFISNLISEKAEKEQISFDEKGKEFIAKDKNRLAVLKQIKERTNSH